MAAGFGLEAAVLVSAQSILTGAAEIAAGMAAAGQEAALRREQRRDERRARAAARDTGRRQQQQAAAAQQMAERLARLVDVVDPAGAAQLEARMTELATAGNAALALSLAPHLADAQARAAVGREAARRAEVARALERLVLDAATPPPEPLLALAEQAVATPSDARAAALTTELRYQVQRHNEAIAAAAEQQARQAAAAIVLEQSLHDLGYAVDDIEETLFVEGGVAHFQQAGWDDYFIRLRIDPARQAMNFNVVRAGTPGEDRKHADMLAEERWCAEFPKLFDTLKARGIPIAVTRLLQAGEAPVQVVDAASLPARAGETARHTPLKAQRMR